MAIYGERIKQYSFALAVSTADNFSVHSSFPINGRIQRVNWPAGTVTTNGSILLIESGNNVLIHKVLNPGTTAVDAYPRIIPVDLTNTSLSGTSPPIVERVINNNVYVTVSGIGTTGSTFGGCTVYYT